jgi:hypothetical protein
VLSESLVGAKTARVDSHQLSAVSISLTRDYGLVQASATLALIDSQAGGQCLASAIAATSLAV